MKLQSILKKELYSYLLSPIIFSVLTVFLALCGYLFYSNIVMAVMFQGTAIKVDLWQYTFNDIRFVLMFVLPVVSMRLLAEEKKLRTLELLMTNPLRRADIILGKYMSALILLALMLLFTGLYPFLYETFFKLDKGTIITGYVGLFLLGGCFLSIGLFISSLTNSQIVASIATLGTVFFLWFIDRSEEYASEGIVSLIYHLSFQKHFFNFNRGVLTLEDSLFFIAVSIFFIYLTSVSLKFQSQGFGLRIWGQKKTVNLNFFRITLNIFLLLISAVLIYWLSYTANIRFDLTRDKMFSLSPITLNALKNLKTPVNLKVFYETGKRYSYEDFLSLMARTTPYFSFNMLNLQKNASLASFYAIESHGGGILEYNEKHNNISTVTEAGIVNTLLMIAVSTEKNAAVKGLKSFSDSYSSVMDILKKKGFTLKNLSVSDREQIADDTNLLIIKADAEDISLNEIQAVENYFNKGGNILIMADPAHIPNTQELLSRFNIDIYDDTIIDKEHALFETGQQGVVMFFNREHPVTATLRSPAIFPKARSVQVGSNISRGFSWTILAQSGRGAEAKLQGEEVLNTGRIPSAVVAEKRPGEGIDKTRGKIIVLGSSSFASDSNIDTLSNRELFSNAVKWLSAHEDKLVEAEMRTVLPSPAYIHLTESMGRIFFWCSVILMPLFFLIIGIFLLYRKSLMK